MKQQQCFSSSKKQKKQLLIFHKMLQLLYKMENQKFINALNDSSNKHLNLLQKWYAIDDQTERKTIKSIHCDYSDANILVTNDITVNEENDTDVAFKNCVSLSPCKTEINDVFVDEADYIHITMPM